MAYTITIVLLLALIAVIYFYNRLIKRQFLVKEAWSGIEVQLKNDMT